MVNNNNNHHNGNLVDSDPNAVLKYDSAGVAINATGNARMLDHLNEFAGSVKHYSQLMKQNASAPTGDEGDISDLVPAHAQNNSSNNNPLLYLNANNSEEQDFVDPVTLLQYDPAGLAMRTRGDNKLLNQLVNFAAALTYYVGLVQERQASTFVKVEEETDEDDSMAASDSHSHLCANPPCFLGWASFRQHQSQ